MSTKHISVYKDILVLVNRLHQLLLEAGIQSIVKDNAASAVMGGFGSPPANVELLILESDLERATPIIESFRKEIAE